MIRIGIDLGGTKIEALAIDPQGTEVFRQRVATPQGDYTAIIDSIHDLVLQLEAEAGEQCSVGIGTPGAISPATGLLKNSNSVCMNGMPVLEDLQHRLQREVRISNDANCFALSEATDGAGAGAHCVFGVIIGTGTGAGIVVNGHVVEGPNSIAGEWGHNPLPWQNDSERPGRTCYCGKKGCVETWLSGPGLSKDHLRYTNDNLDAEEIITRALSEDKKALATLIRYEDRMARCLSHVINILDPDVIVLGGGMSNNQRLYEKVPAILLHYVFSDTVQTRLLPPVFGDASGVRGAAWLWAAD